MPRRKTEETMTDKRRKFMVEEILVLIEQGKTRAEAWRLTHPESTATPESMRVMCSNQIAWYHKKYPTGYEQLMRRLRAQERRRDRRRAKPPEEDPSLSSREEELEELMLEKEAMESIGLPPAPWVIEKLNKLRAGHDPDPPRTAERAQGT